MPALGLDICIGVVGDYLRVTYLYGRCDYGEEVADERTQQIQLRSYTEQVVTL